MTPCSDCRGTGKVSLFLTVETCRKCGGTGNEPVEAQAIVPVSPRVSPGLKTEIEGRPEKRAVVPGHLAAQVAQKFIEQMKKPAPRATDILGEPPVDFLFFSAKVEDNRQFRCHHVVLNIGEGIVLNVRDATLAAHKGDYGRAMYATYTEKMTDHFWAGVRFGLKKAAQKYMNLTEGMAESNVKAFLKVLAQQIKEIDRAQ